MKTKIGKLEINNILMNASGVHCITDEDINFLDNLITGAIITKSVTINSREGNLLPRYYNNNILSINSSGLPNNGYKYYIDLAKNNNYSKPIIISVAGLTINDNIEIIKEINNNSQFIDGIELNLSCPNISGKSQIGYNFKEMDIFLEKVSAIINPNLNFGLKLPPYFDMEHFTIVSNIINKYSIDTITCINSLGNGLVIDPYKNETVIKPKEGHGGIGGKAIKSIALSNIRQFYKLTNCEIIGCGGINNGIDVYEHILCGASAVQIGTEFYNDKTCFDIIYNEFLEFIQTKKYNNIMEFKGKLKTI